MRVRVEGTQQLSQIARVLEAQGNSRALKRRMSKAFKKAAGPITRDQRNNLAEKMPHRGGLAAELASGVRTPIRTSWARATVDIVDSWPGHDMRAVDAGLIKHPVFGSSRWVSQRVTPDTLTQPFLDHKPTVVAELAKEMTALAEEISRET